MVRDEPLGVEQARLSLGTFIREHHAHILEAWERSVCQLPSSQELSRPRLLDHLPDLLERISRVVGTVHSGAHESLAGLPEVHALERLDSGFDLDEVAEEYALLRACILELYGEHAQASGAVSMAEAMREVVSFNRTFDEAVSAAVSRYARAHERTLVALDRISEAALGSEALDIFLPKLLRVMLETAEAVDSVTLLLREGDVLRVRASVGLEALVAGGFSVRVGEGFSGKIAAERHPLALRSASTEPLVRGESLWGLGIRALYGVPLVQGEEVIGVAHMGSRTAHEFSNEDKLLFRAMVSRVTGLIVQASLAARERTARQKAEESLALVDMLLATAPVGLCFLDRELRYVRINHTLAAINGVSLEETLGRTPREVIPEMAPIIERYQRHVLDTGEPVLHVEVTGTTRGQGGAPGYWLVSYYPVWDGAGQVSLVGSVVVDITDRKRAEEALAQVEALVEAAPAGLALLDSELRYVHINEALASSNGQPVEAHLGKRVSEVVPESARIVEPVLRRVLETGEALRGQEFSLAPAHAPGGLHHFVGDYFPVRAREGRVVGVGGVIMDITERKQQEERLRQTAEFRERFLGVVSHDLRNPLNAILLSANALLRAEGIPASHTKMVRRIVTSGERMVRMIGELLDFTRGRLGGGIPIQPRPTNLRHLCRHVLEELEVSHPGRELRLEADGRFQGEWDPDRLAQLLGNLGKNALDYSPAGTPVDFTLHDEGEGEGVRLEVHNEGSPIPVGMLPGIFEPFRRGVEGDAHPTSGLGLGLFIVQQIAEAHGGSVEVRSHEGDGTTFTVRLPRRASGVPEAPGAMN